MTKEEAVKQKDNLEYIFAQKKKAAIEALQNWNATKNDEFCSAEIADSARIEYYKLWVDANKAREDLVTFMSEEMGFLGEPF